MDSHNQWKLLDESGKSDEDAKDILEASFLYALRKIQASDPSRIPMLWVAYGNYWKDRLVGGACAYLKYVSDELHSAHIASSTPHNGPTYNQLALRPEQSPEE